MNVTGTARVPQYEVERSIRAVKAAAEQRQNEQAVGQAQNASRAEAAQVLTPRDTETAAGQGGGRGPQVDAYIPKGPRTPIAEDGAEDAGSLNAAVQNPAAQTSAVRNPSAESSTAKNFAAWNPAALENVSEAEEAAEAPEPFSVSGETDGVSAAAGAQSGTATYNTDKVDREVHGLKVKLEQYQRRLRGERDPQKAYSLEKQVVQLRRELLWKNTDVYRRKMAVAAIQP